MQRPPPGPANARRARTTPARLPVADARRTRATSPGASRSAAKRRGESSRTSWFSRNSRSNDPCPTCGRASTHSVASCRSSAAARRTGARAGATSRGLSFQRRSDGATPVRTLLTDGSLSATTRSACSVRPSRLGSARERWRSRNHARGHGRRGGRGPPNRLVVQDHEGRRLAQRTGGAGPWGRASPSQPCDVPSRAGVSSRADDCSAPWLGALVRQDVVIDDTPGLTASRCARVCGRSCLRRRRGGHRRTATGSRCACTDPSR